MGAAEQAALIRAFGTTEARIRTQMTAFVLGLFGDLGSWRDADIARFVNVVVPAMAGAQRQVGSLTDAYVASMLSDMLGSTFRPTGQSVRTGAALRNGVDPAEVYARPFRQLWQALAAGSDLATALALAQRRLWQLATSDLQLAKTHAAQTAMSADDHVVGFRRVLTGTHSCGLCVVASTQRYHRSDLLPIHPGCDCGIAPIVGSHDPGQVVNEPLLEGTHQAIQDRFGVSDRSARVPDYRDVLITHQHGELGPVLARRGDTFTGPSDLH